MEIKVGMILKDSNEKIIEVTRVNLRSFSGKILSKSNSYYQVGEIYNDWSLTYDWKLVNTYFHTKLYKVLNV